jgi:general secretion pathway protein G
MTSSIRSYRKYSSTKGLTKGSAKGFTLVEILIVVIILGILAAIVIPQFTNASQDARKSSLTSQLQTIRSQVELYKLQHLDELPPGFALTSGEQWAEMIVKTDENHDIGTAAEHRFGPYLQAPPVNPLNGFSKLFVATSDVTLGGASGATDAGWVLNSTNGKIWSTAKNPAVVYNEANPADAVNTADAPSN